jgi:hypothetical protein
VFVSHLSRGTGQLIGFSVIELEDMVTVALNDMSSLSPGFEIGAAHTRQGILKTLFSALTLPQRALRVHTIKMLNHVQDLKREIRIMFRIL